MHIDRLERFWLAAVAVVLGAFLAALVASVVLFGVSLPAPAGRVDPTRLEATEFGSPGLRSDGDRRYTFTVVSRMWRFDVGQRSGQQAELRVPAGSEITFVATSADVIHGFQIEDHNVNLMLIPGQISRKTVRFDTPGTYRILCHEYCGPGHQTMVASVIIE